MGTSWSDEANKDSSQQIQPQSNPKQGQQPTKTPQNDGKLKITNNNIHNKPKDAMKALPKLPHNCEAIIKDSDRPIDRSSIDKLYEQLCAGVYLNGKKKKYWVEKKNNTNCFMVFANGLTITWAENPNFWHLYETETSDYGNITVAQLRNVCWLEIHGRIHTEILTQRVTYQAAYLIKLEDTSYGWHVPVNFRLTLPNGTKQEHKECLMEKPKEEWVRIPVGEFTVSPENVGEVEFSLFEYEGGNWKKGLIIKGVIIEPKA